MELGIKRPRLAGRRLSIYTISDAATGLIYYVGVTVQKLQTRLSGHLTKSSFSIVGRLPIKHKIEEIDSCYCPAEATELEEYWIAQLKAWGFTLFNHKTRIPYKHR